MFCYIKYCANSSHSVRQSLPDNRKSVSPGRNRITFPMQISNDTSTPSPSPKLAIVKANSFDLESVESDNTLTTQLVTEKSHMLINKFRNQRHFDSNTEVVNSTPFNEQLQGGFTFASDNAERTSRVHRVREKTVDMRQSIRPGRKTINYRSLPKAAMHAPRKTHFASNLEPNVVFMINPDCFVQILLDYIYEQVNVDKTMINLDLCDVDGNPMKLFAYEKFESGKYILEDRQTYYVVKYEFTTQILVVDDDGAFKSIEPLLRKTNKEETDLFAKVNRHVKRASNAGLLRKSSSKSTDF